MDEYQGQEYKLMIYDHKKGRVFSPLNDQLKQIRIPEEEKDDFEVIVDLINRTFKQFDDYEVTVILSKAKRKKVKPDVS